jgi:threonylcarbamoyladenosine tRNA methylthiotransferase MtaB
MKVYLGVIGCKLNQAEVERWAHELALAGHEAVDSPDQADLCVVHSCTVTRQAAKKSRNLARRVARAGGKTVMTGCYAQELLQNDQRLPGVELLLGTGDTPRLLEALQEHGLLSEARPSPAQNEAEAGSALPALPPLGTSRTRAFVKAQDGCDMRCAFCVIPRVRGPARSRPLEAVVGEVQERVAAGFREVVLTGVQLSSYRDGDAQLHDLVRQVLTRTGVERLRLSSIAPWRLDDELLALWANPRLCRHLHLSLQSGCDATLRRMRRPYTTARYAETLARARAMIPDLAVTTDVIVGFPGETEEEFRESLAFVEESGFARVHVFPYSPRPGTEAARMPHQVPEPVKRARVAAMRAAGEAGGQAFACRFVGREMAVLWESRQDGVWRGLTDNYLRVSTRDDADLHNRITATKLVRLSADALWGEVR